MVHYWIFRLLDLQLLVVSDDSIALSPLIMYINDADPSTWSSYIDVHSSSLALLTSSDFPLRHGGNAIPEYEQSAPNTDAEYKYLKLISPEFPLCTYPNPGILQEFNSR